MRRLLLQIICGLILITFFLCAQSNLQSVDVYAASLAVINGGDVPIGEQPWVVSIVQSNISDGYFAQFCGGTLIDPQWVLTSAHCTLDEKALPFAPTDLEILVGRRQLSSDEGARIQIDKIIRHWAFAANTYQHDVALLHLQTPAKSAVVSLSAPLHDTLENPDTLAMVVGWGVTGKGQSADVLQRAWVPVVNNQTCQSRYAQFGLRIQTDTLCAGYKTGGTDACIGDSGGPLLVWDTKNSRWTQIGIISWGASCAKPSAFGVYSRISSYRYWISAVVAR